MGLFGRLLALPVRLVNAPVRAVEDLISIDKPREDERIFSCPLDALADELDKIDEGRD